MLQTDNTSVKVDFPRAGFLTVLLILAPVVLSGCLGDDDTLTVTDMVGRKVEVPRSVDRVVALGVGALRFVTYLGGSDKVVGIETSAKPDSNNQARTYMIAHPEYDALPSIGPSHGGDEVKIIEAEPDVIFKTTYSEGDCEELQDSLGIPVVALLGYCSWDNSPDLDDNTAQLFAQIRLVGKVLGKEQKGEELISNVRAVLADIEERTHNISPSEKQKVYVGDLPGLEDDSAVYTYARHPMIDRLGALNVITYDMLDGEKEGEVDVNSIPPLDPEVLFIYLSGGQSCTTNLSDIFSASGSGWDQITAVKEGNIYSALGHYKYGYNFDTMLADLYWAGKVLYPDRFADIDPAEKADEIFTLWVGSPVYDILDSSNGQEGFTKIEIS